MYLNIKLRDGRRVCLHFGTHGVLVDKMPWGRSYSGAWSGYMPIHFRVALRMLELAAPGELDQLMCQPFPRRAV